VISSKIIKGICSVVSDTRLFLLEEANSSMLTEGASSVAIVLALSRNIFAILYFNCNGNLLEYAMQVAAKCRL